MRLSTSGVQRFFFISLGASLAATGALATDHSATSLMKEVAHDLSRHRSMISLVEDFSPGAYRDETLAKIRGWTAVRPPKVEVRGDELHIISADRHDWITVIDPQAGVFKINGKRYTHNPKLTFDEITAILYAYSDRPTASSGFLRWLLPEAEAQSVPAAGSVREGLHCDDPQGPWATWDELSKLRPGNASVAIRARERATRIKKELENTKLGWLLPLSVDSFALTPNVLVIWGTLTKFSRLTTGHGLYFSAAEYACGIEGLNVAMEKFVKACWSYLGDSPNDQSTPRTTIPEHLKLYSANELVTRAIKQPRDMPEKIRLFMDNNGLSTTASLEKAYCTEELHQNPDLDYRKQKTPEDVRKVRIVEGFAKRLCANMKTVQRCYQKIDRNYQERLRTQEARTKRQSKPAGNAPAAQAR